MEKHSIQVEPDHYNFISYMGLNRWSSIYYQIKEIISLNPKTVLELGPGCGVLGFMLKQNNIDYKSLDIDGRLKPDYVGDLFNIDIPPNTFDVACAFQVLEHLPFKDFERSLKALFRLSKKYVIISLPNRKKKWRFFFHIPPHGVKQFSINKPRIGLKKHVFDGQHYWEINKKGYSLKTVEDKIIKSGCRIVNSYQLFENPYHQFFILEKK